MSTSVANKKIITKTAKKTRKQRRKEKEVTNLQERSKCILPQTTFKRIVTQTASDYSSNRLRFNEDAVRALQVAAEQELTSIFEGTAFCAELGKRDTISVEDMRNFQQMRNI